MSKISGFGSLGNPNEAFTIQGHTLGGRDGAVSVQRPTANVKREAVAALAKYLSGNIKSIRDSIAQLEILAEMMVVDKETDSVVLDKDFINDFKDCVKNIKEKYEDTLKVANQ
jgi:hypothetical protein